MRSFWPRLQREQAPSENGDAIPPTQCDSQQEEMYLSIVEEESGDESMLMGTSMVLKMTWM